MQLNKINGINTTIFAISFMISFLHLSLFVLNIIIFVPIETLFLSIPVKVQWSMIWKTAMAINIKGNSTIKDLIVKNIFNSNKIQKCMGQNSRKIKDIRISRTQPRGGISWVLRQPKDSQVHSNSSGQVKWTLRTFLSGHLENPNSRKLIDSQNRPT